MNIWRGKNLAAIEYKLVSIQTGSFPPGDVARVADIINGSFPPSDVKAVVNDGEFQLHLNQLDVVRFKAALLDGTNGSEGFAKAVFDVVDSIGSYGLKGSKRMFVGYNAERKVRSRKEKEKSRSKHYYANDNDFSRKNNPLPEDSVNKIVCADSLDYLKTLPDNCIDIIITSPPYNFGLDYENHNDTSHWDQYYDMLFKIFKECIRVLKYGGRFVVNVQPLYSDYIPTHHIISSFFIQQKMIWKGEIIWEKNNYNCKYCSWGSWKSPASPYLKYTWEFVEVFCKGNLKKPGSKENIDINEEEFKQWVVAKWSIAPERNMKEYGHPAMFPEQLVERVLKLFSYKNDVVLDPFNGAGTTTVVAKRLHRRYLGIDISREYCDTALKRLEAETEQLRLF
ncbi:MAG: site-specific DNA-methyltransferase [Clostridiales bacterium]|nr:site-specific DNA-methyltransferase [Clostridiales bacterium]